MNWDLKKYNFICNECNKIIKNNQNNELILSNSAFYVIREHKFSIDKFKIIFEKNYYFNGVVFFIKNFFISFIKIFFYIFQKNFLLNSVNKNIFISHKLNKKQNLKYKENDFYFSHILKKLEKNSYSVLYINHSKKKNVNFYLNNNLDFFSEIILFLKVCKNSLYLLWLFIFSKRFNKDFIFFGLIYNFSQEHFQNLRIYFNIIKIIKKNKIKKIITTFEGHAFERMIYLAASKFNNNIIKIGFAHSIIFKYQNSIKLNLSLNISPNIILTSGNLGEVFLKKNLQNEKILIDNIGSNRFVAKKKFKGHKIKNLLFIPEGHEEENKIFFKIANNILKKNPNINIIWRFHPIFSDDAAYLIKKNIGNDQARFKLSTHENIEKDFELCDTVLFRGSTLVVQAARYGLLPIYYNQNSEININPFYSNSQSCIVVSSIDELNNVITNDYRLLSNDFTDLYFSNIDNLNENFKKYFLD